MIAIEKVVAELKKDFAFVEARPVVSRGTERVGIAVGREEKIMPVFYPDDFTSEMEMIGYIRMTFDDNMDRAPKDAVDIVKDRDEVLKRVVLSPVSENTAFSYGDKAIVAKKFADTVFICRLMLGEASAVVSRSHIDAIGISEEELIEAAKANTIAIEKTTKDLGELFGASNGEMYILSVKGGSWGAGVLEDVDFLNKVRSEIGDFWILPSSIHEVLAYKKNDRVTVDDLYDMVSNVNDVEVEVHERLSYMVFEFDGELKIAERG